MRKETLNDFIINGFYGTFIGADTIARYYKTKLNSIYGKSIFNKKENKTMTNYQHLRLNDEALNKFKIDISRLDWSVWFKKYGVKGNQPTVCADLLDWLMADYIPPKTTCVDLYRLFKFVNNPALFSLDEGEKIIPELYKLDRYFYQKDVTADSYAVISSNAFEIIIKHTRQVRRGLIENEYGKLSKFDLDLSEERIRYYRV